MFDRFAERWRAFLLSLRNLGETIGDGFSWWFGGVGELPRQVWALLVALVSGLRWLVLLPLRVLQMVWEWISRLRGAGVALEKGVEELGKSVRDSAHDLRESIENQPRSLRSKWASWRLSVRRWFRVKPVWQKSLVLSTFALLLLSIAGAWPAWNWIRGWRAERLLGQGEARFEEGRVYEAFFKIQAAYFTDPANTDILARLIDLSREIGNPNTLRFGDALMARERPPTSSLAILAEEAQDRRRPDLARAYLRELERLDASHPAIPKLRIRSLLAQGNRALAFDEAETFHRERDFDREVFLLFASLGMESEASETAARVRAELEGLWPQEGEAGRLAAMILLAHTGGMNFERADLLVERILSDPGSSREDRLYAFGKALELEVRPFDAIREPLREEFDFGVREEAVSFALLLFSLGRYAELLEELALETVREERSLFTVYLLSLMECGRAAEALEGVRGTDGTVLPELERLVLEGRLLRALGREEAFVSTIERAIARASEENFAVGERLLRQLEDDRFLRLYYEKFARSPSTRVQSNANLLAFAYTEKDNEALVELIRRTPIELLDEVPQIQGLLAYLRGLADEGVPANIRKCEALVARFPYVLDFRVALAVNYFQAGFLSDAEAILQDTAIADLSRLPGMHAVTQAVLARVTRQGAEAPAVEDDELLELERSFLQQLWVDSIDSAGPPPDRGA
jgi:hypothetical protein